MDKQTKKLLNKYRNEIIAFLIGYAVGLIFKIIPLIIGVVAWGLYYIFNRKGDSIERTADKRKS